MSEESGPITAKELRELLADVPDDVIVIMSKDAEGNRYSPLASYSTGMHYEADSGWSGEIRNPEEKDSDDQTYYYDSEEIKRIKELPEAFVLWPTN
jgi:hypothetical protein